MDFCHEQCQNMLKKEKFLTKLWIATTLLFPFFQTSRSSFILNRGVHIITTFLWILYFKPSECEWQSVSGFILSNFLFYGWWNHVLCVFRLKLQEINSELFFPLPNASYKNERIWHGTSFDLPLWCYGVMNLLRDALYINFCHVKTGIWNPQ